MLPPGMTVPDSRTPSSISRDSRTSPGTSSGALPPSSRSGDLLSQSEDDFLSGWVIQSGSADDVAIFFGMMLCTIDLSAVFFNSQCFFFSFPAERRAHHLWAVRQAACPAPRPLRRACRPALPDPHWRRPSTPAPSSPPSMPPTRNCSAITQRVTSPTTR